ncbi:MAG: adenylate/guanylate cyclase domain-containing protein [Actinomycetota bacterium]
MRPPETKYTKSGDVNIAYQVAGEGTFDLVFVFGWISNVELAWEEPNLARFLGRLASFSRLVLFDKRGTGLSDRVSLEQLPTMEQRMDDVRAVMDAAESERAALFGISEGGPMSILFAATYPDRTVALVTCGTYAKRIWSPEYPWAPTLEERQRFFDAMEHHWGQELGLDTLAPSMQDDPAIRRWLETYIRRSASPGAALALAKMNTLIDVRHVLASVNVPALILHRTGDKDSKVEEGRYIAEHIPEARFAELPGADHLPWIGDQDAILDEVEEFLTGDRPVREPDRILATVLFTDIVGSTERAQGLGDRAWRDVLARHDSLVRRELQLFRGREIDTAGDGFLAAFDGPARAVRCAWAIRDSMLSLGLEVRAGLHTGECEVMGEKLAGVAVHTGARVAAEAGPGEVLVSSTVKDLVAGSGIEFEDRGLHQLKDLGEWRLFAVRAI